MGSDGEYYADGVDKCKKCGSPDIRVELKRNLIINRVEHKNAFEDGSSSIEISHEYKDDEHETLYCSNCGEEL